MIEIQWMTKEKEKHNDSIMFFFLFGPLSAADFYPNETK
jgi:hypothetical protein